MTEKNTLTEIRRTGCGFENVEARLAALESRMEDIEAVLASLCLSPKKPGSSFMAKDYTREGETATRIDDLVPVNTSLLYRERKAAKISYSWHSMLCGLALAGYIVLTVWQWPGAADDEGCSPWKFFAN